jgi:hypothetical protein
MTRALLVLLAIVLPVMGSGIGPSAQPARPPKLVVILVVDQMRADYLVRFGANFNAGLRRLLTDGAWFTEAAYPYLNTVTCPGHSTIGTGSFPYRHGMILNNWFDVATGRSPYCTDDPSMTEISYNGLSPVQGDSAKQMLVPAIGEQIMARGGRSVVMSLKPRSSIPLTGKSATAAVWFDDRGGWVTSSAYTSAPVPFLQQFINANPLSADVDKVWDRTLPASAYQYSDDAEGEGVTAGWTRTFPHPLASEAGKVDQTFYSRWQRTPFADEYLGRMAAAAVDSLKLGQGESTDFLGVSFSTLDGSGHVFGPRSHEVQDIVVRLDRTIGRLLAHLDQTVGSGRYVLGLSADHGVGDIPEQAGRGGRLAPKTLIAAVQPVLDAALGPGRHVLATAYTDIYLSPDAKARVAANPSLKKAVLEALRAVPGITQAFCGEDLADAGARASDDPVRHAAALSYHPDRSGSFIVVPAENWLLSSAVTTHGTLYPYDQRVPVVLFGASVGAGRYPQAATPADLVPTLTRIAKIPIAPTDGRVLREALRGVE